MFVQSLLLLGQDKNVVNSIGNRITFLGHGYSGGYGWKKENAILFLEKEKRENPDLIVPYFTGAAVLVDVKKAKEIGLFDTPFYMYHEDVDASFNARIHGYKTVVEPKSIVYHYYEFSRSIKKFYWMERNRFVVNLTYYKWQTLLLLFIPFLCVEIASLFLSIKSGWYREKIRSWKFFLFPSSWRWILLRRKKIQCNRKISDRIFFKWMSGEILFQESGYEGSGADGIKKDASGFILQKIANPILKNIWKANYFLMRW